MRETTKKQERVLNFIKAHLKKHGYPPTRREISQHFGWDSMNAAQQHLDALEKKGKITVAAGTARGIAILCAA